MSAPFVIVLAYVIGGTPGGDHAELVHFEVSQASLGACEKTAEEFRRDFPNAAVAEGRLKINCKMNIPVLKDPASPPDCWDYHNALIQPASCQSFYFQNTGVDEKP